MNGAHCAEHTYIFFGAHAFQPSASALRSPASGHCIELHQEHQDSAELCLALFAESFVSCIDMATERGY